MKQKITKSIVDKLQKGEVCWDTEVTGFAIRFQTRDKKYYLKTSVNGRQRWIRIGQHGSPWTVETARDKARSLLGQKADGASIADLRKEKRNLPTVADLAERYLAEHAKPFKKPLSFENDKSNLTNHVLPKLGSTLLADVDQEAIEKFLREVATGKIAQKQAKSRQGFKGGAIVRGGTGVSNRCRSLLSKMFNLSEKWGMTAQNTNPVRHASKYKENTKERYLSKEEMDALGVKLSAEDIERPYYVAAYRLLMLTGARRNEILTLKWDYVDLQRQTLFLPDSKSGKKPIPLPSAAVEILQALPRVDGNPYVIVGHREGKHLVNLRKHWSAMCKEIGLNEVRLHDLRHTFASSAIMKGVPLAFVSKLLGHKDCKTTERYAHIAQDPIRAASEMVAQDIAKSFVGKRDADKTTE